MQKSQTKNDNISVSNSIFLKCTKGQGIKISPLFIKRNHNDDKLYYKVELQKRDDATGTWNVIKRVNRSEVRRQSLPSRKALYSC